MVERSAVNRNVAGSSPARGANLTFTIRLSYAAFAANSYISLEKRTSDRVAAAIGGE